MIVMTLNCWGLASKPKKLAICRLVEDQQNDILFLQESMGDGVLFAGELEDVEWIVLYLSGCQGKIRWTSSRLEVLNLPFIECVG